jgi:signal transduction histidine kinase
VAVWTGALAVAVCAGLLGRFLLATIYELQDTQAKLGAQARSEERRHIAREIHDVIAHSLTVTMLQLGAARLAAERNDRDELAAALREAEDAARASLNDVRRTVGLLGQDGSAPGVVQPDARDLLDLVDQYRAAGMDVRIDIMPPDSPLDAVLGLVVYRVVQESLANAAKHAPGSSTTVSIRADGDLVIEVCSRGGTIVQGPGSRRGLSGMEQRVHALKGQISTGPCENGWDVVATLPLHAHRVGVAG